MTEKEKMLAGMLYDPSDPELTSLLVKARKLARRYNLIDEDDPEKKEAVLRELLCNTPNLPGLQAPIYFDYGCNTTFGKFSGRTAASIIWNMPNPLRSRTTAGWHRT